MIDFHCHLDLYPSPRQMVKGCDDRGMWVLSVTTTPSAWEGTLDIAANSDGVTTALGLHPQLVHERMHEMSLFEELLPKTRFVGEVGLDGGPEYRDHWEQQVAVFDSILNLCARAGGRVLSIHSRRAATAVLDGLERIPSAGTPVLHWFSGTFRELDRAAALGCWFSVGPAMFQGKRAGALVARMPRDRVLTESDGPFARINECAAQPWDVSLAVRGLGQAWNDSNDSTTRQLRENLQRILAE